MNYTYDYAGNRLTRDIPSSLYSTDDRDQVYTYDGLQRLQQTNTGTLSSGTITDASAKFRQKWGLDQLGNWPTFQQDGKNDYSVVANNSFADSSDVDQDRTQNDVNEITNIENAQNQPQSYTPGHDAAGNMTTTVPQPADPELAFDMKYDAWNRLVAVVNTDLHATNPYVKYEYDGQNRMIVRELDTTANGSIDETRHFYYNEDWQVIVEAEGTTTITATAIYAYHPHYVDAVVNRMRSTDMHVYVHDANFNVTALLTSSGSTATVKERYSYTPYGEVTILNGASDSDGNEWTVDTNGSDMQNEILYTGRWVDPVTGLQLNRNRWYHAPLGRWVNRDPIGYEGSEWNLYEYVAGIPISYLDPLGLISCELRCKITYIHFGSRSELRKCLDACNPPPPPGPWWMPQFDIPQLVHPADEFADQCGRDSAPPPPPAQPIIPPDLGPDGPCEGNRNECCVPEGKSFGRPNPCWPPEGIDIPGQDQANGAAQGAGCAKCNKGKGQDKGYQFCRSCCEDVAGGSYAVYVGCQAICESQKGSF